MSSHAAVAPPATAAAPPALAEALRDPACYPHPAAPVELHETSISWVLLAGEFAYKIKKPLKLPYLDYSTLEERRHWCHEEVLVNRRTAPALYLGVVPITGTPWSPRVDGTGPAIEYAVRMMRFEPGALFSELVAAGKLAGEHVDALARRLARFHASAEVIPYDPGRDHAAHAAQSAIDNFRDMALTDPRVTADARVARLRDWTARETRALAGAFVDRAAGGFERECHGDLHMGNVALVGGEPVIFDAIEFSRGLRCTDVAADLAFAAMDLERLGQPRLATRLLNGYLEATGDYGMLAVLRFYEVYRAMVRAKVALLRREQSPRGSGAAAAGSAELESHLAAAMRLAAPARPVLLLMHGLSGSGKTTVSGPLAEALGAIRVRSDVERKRLHGLAAHARGSAAPGAGIYGTVGSRAAYERLLGVARTALRARFACVVDAAFLRREERDRFCALARELDAGFGIVACEAPQALLGERVCARALGGADASDAGPAVLEWQLAHAEPLGSDERLRSTAIDTTDPQASREAIASLARSLAAARRPEDSIAPPQAPAPRPGHDDRRAPTEEP